jgi:hypothetical protein
MGPPVDPKPVGRPYGVNPDDIVLSNQFLQPCTVRLANYVGIGCHVGRIKLMSEPFRKSTKGSARRGWQRTDNSAHIQFVLGASGRFFIFLLSGNNHEGDISKAAQQLPNIQYPLLRTISGRHGPVGCHKEYLGPVSHTV